MQRINKFLLVLGFFIIGVGLFYGAPKTVIEDAFGLSIQDNALHIFRAIMGLYCGIGGILLLGAKNNAYAKSLLLLATVFFGSVAGGRIISFALDGNIPRIALIAVAIELLLFVVCLVRLLTENKRH